MFKVHYFCWGGNCYSPWAPENIAAPLVVPPQERLRQTSGFFCEFVCMHVFEKHIFKFFIFEIFNCIFTLSNHFSILNLVTHLAKA